VGEGLGAAGAGKAVVGHFEQLQAVPECVREKRESEKGNQKREKEGEIKRERERTCE